MKIKSFILLFSVFLLHQITPAQDSINPNVLNKFITSEHFGERILNLRFEPEITIHINAPSKEMFDSAKKTLLIFYALPSGNSIEWTIGKKLKPGDDWHFDIQHIGAQTRFLREVYKEANIIVA